MRKSKYITNRCSTRASRTRQFVSRHFVVLLRKSIPQKTNLQTAAELSVIKAYMKKVLFLTIAFLIAGCAKTSHTPDLSSSIKIKDREIKISEPILYIAEEPLFEKVVKNEKISLKEAPFEESYFVCGGVFPAEQDTAELLKNAKTVLVLKGSYEKWTPIEGKFKKYIVFKLQ